MELIVNNFNHDFEDLESRITQHNAVNELHAFGYNLKSNVLKEEHLYVFFSTLWAFFREVPTGILSLALRISDDWMLNHDEWEGTGKAAPILYADVDEFGLQSDSKLFPTHHHLFLKLIEALNLDKRRLLEHVNIEESGKKFGELTREYYRIKSIPKGIGFHMASEFTSSVEFQYFLDGFKANKNTYGLIGDNQSALSFFHIHTVVEPLHLELGKLAAKDYLEKDNRVIHDIEDGAIAFMDGFETLFHCLNNRLFLKNVLI